MKRFVSLVLMVAVLVGCFGITGEAKSKPIRITKAGDVKHGKVKITTNTREKKVVYLVYTTKSGKDVSKKVKTTSKKSFKVKVPKKTKENQFGIVVVKKKDLWNGQIKPNKYAALAYYWGKYCVYNITSK